MAPATPPPICRCLLAGLGALYCTPRGDEPEGVVRLGVVMVLYHGGTSEELEKVVSARLERLRYQIDGVE